MRSTAIVKGLPCSMSKTILIAGATGLIGSTTLQQALADPRYERVIAVVRIPLAHHPKLEQWVHADLLHALRPQRVDAVLCCLGTTIGKEGGDQAKFIHVDKDLVVGLGRWARTQGVPVMSVVSAIGADAHSRVFYNRVKGEMERDMKALGLPTLHLFQPSILTGPRKEVRIGERIGIAVARVLSPLLPARYRPMPHDVLAAALLHSVDRTTSGTYDNAAIRTL
jgi:uncharacterized protein YbjT (DUF2867 family)